MKGKKLFSLGPVEMFNETLQIGSNKLPYFRTNDFSKINLNICSLLKKFVYTSKDSESIILTSSGSGAMEAAVINVFDENDKVLIVNGGSFGNRFCEICKIHHIPYVDIKLKLGETLKLEHLEGFRNKRFTGLLINAHETSTGVYHDLKFVGQFCREQNMLFIVDAISSFLADQYYMDDWNIDITILSSQKSLALPPGLSFLILNNKVKKIIYEKEAKTLYFNLKSHIENMKRGQTPFTPAVGIILQLENRLKIIDKIGVQNIIKNTEIIANDFREKIKELPFKINSERLSNALTPLTPLDENLSAFDIFIKLKEEFNIVVCPNGGQLSEKLFRVGHMGNLTLEDNSMLVENLNNIIKENNSNNICQSDFIK